MLEVQDLPFTAFYPTQAQLFFTEQKQTHTLAAFFFFLGALFTESASVADLRQAKLPKITAQQLF